MQFIRQHIKQDTKIGYEGLGSVPTCPEQAYVDNRLATDSNELSFCSDKNSLRYTRI